MKYPGLAWFTYHWEQKKPEWTVSLPPFLGARDLTYCCLSLQGRNSGLKVVSAHNALLSRGAHFSLVLTTHVFQQGSIISKQKGKINRKFGKLYVLFPVADTQYTSLKGMHQLLYNCLRKRQLSYSSYLAASENEKSPSPRKDFLQDFPK